MSLKSDLLISYLEKHTIGDFRSQPPRHLTANEIMEALWVINPNFGEQVDALKDLTYQDEFEPLADKAIEKFVSTGKWLTSLEVKRILFERHRDILVWFAMAEKIDSAKVHASIPSGLPETAIPAFLILKLLHGAPRQIL